jgi:hypothetical protein
VFTVKDQVVLVVRLVIPPLVAAEDRVVDRAVILLQVQYMPLSAAVTGAAALQHFMVMVMVVLV